MNTIIRMTDSVCIDKYAILKPEVEIEHQGVHDNDDMEECTMMTLERLAIVIDVQLNEIAGRMDKADCIRVLSTAGIDPRFIEKVKARRNSLG